MQDVFGGNGLCSDTAFGKCDVFGNVAGQVVADHQHVKMFIESVACVWSRGIGTGWKNVVMFNDGNDVGRMSTACTFSVVSVDSAILESSDGSLNKARFVECVCVNESLNVVLVADAVTSQWEIIAVASRTTYLKQVSMALGVVPQSS